MRFASHSGWRHPMAIMPLTCKALHAAVHYPYWYRLFCISACITWHCTVHVYVCRHLVQSL